MQIWAHLYLLIIKKKNIWILGKDPNDGLDDTTLTTKKEHSANFSGQQKKFCFIWHYNGIDSYILINDHEIYKFKAKDFKVNASPLSLGIA